MHNSLPSCLNVNMNMMLSDTPTMFFSLSNSAVKKL